MKVVDLSTGEGIGANCHYVEMGPFKVVIDAGVNPKAIGNESLPSFHQLPEHLDAIILTHCHLDHLGALPVLARSHPRAPIMMSMPSMMLARRMLHNSVNVMLRQREDMRRNDLPLYTHGEVDGMGRQIVPMPYARSRPIERAGQSLHVTFHPSGHIAGAAGIELQWKDESFFHSGDVLFESQKHLPGARFPNRHFDTLVLETTRGRASRAAHSDRATELTRMFGLINERIRDGGSVLIPVFALGRMQEMLCLLHDARTKGIIPNFPIYGSGLGLDLANYFDEISKKTGLVKFRRNMVKDLKILPVPSELKPGRSPANPGLFLVSSGMMVEHTPSYYVAASILHDPKNLVCIVGYCDPDTPGGKLMATSPGEEFTFSTMDFVTPLLANVERFDLSGHADREELLAYAKQVRADTIYLAHGDPDAREWFSKNLSLALPSTTVVNPKQGTVHSTNGAGGAVVN